MGWVRALAVDPSNQWFATGAGDRVVKVRRGVLRGTSTDRTTRLDLGSCIWRIEAVVDGPHLHHPRIGSFGSASIPLLLRRGQGASARLQRQTAHRRQMVKCWDLEVNKVIRHYHGHFSGVYSLSSVLL